jgi:hypothetical protein
MNPDIKVDEDIFNTQSLILNFDASSFYPVMLVFLLIILTVLFFHGICLVRPYRLKGFNFTKGKKEEYGGMFNFLRMTFKAYFDIGLGLTSKVDFIRVYGIDVLNFLNFETKMFICVFVQCVLILLSVLPYKLFADKSFVIHDFVTGHYPFSDFCYFFFAYSVTFNLLLSSATSALFNNARDFHLTFILENTDLSSRYSLIAHVCYLSNINKNMKREELVIAIEQLLRISRENFILELFPRISRICDIRIQMDELREVHQYHQKQKGLWFRLFYNKKKDAKTYKERMSKLQFLYDEERKAKVTYNGRGMLFFYRIGDLRTFYNLKDEFSDRSKFEFEDKMMPLIKPKSVQAVGQIRRTFLLSYNELIIRNLDVNSRVNTFFRMGFYVLLFLLLFFVSTPNTLIQEIINLWSNTPEDQERTRQFFKRKDIQLIMAMAFPMITALFNLLIIISIEQLGQFQRFTRHSSYQTYMIRFAFLYLMTNMFIIPGFALGTNQSLFEMLIVFKYSVNEMLKHIRVEERGQYFATFIVQTSVTSFICYVPILKEIARTRFSYRLLFKYLKEIRIKAYRKKEIDLFEFGYNYSVDLVIVFIMASFGICQPLIFIAGCVFFLVKGFANISAMISFYKGQSYAKTKYLDNALNRLRFAPCAGQIMLAIKALLIKRYHLFVVCVIVAVASCVQAITRFGSAFQVKELFDPRYEIKLGREGYKRPQLPE